MSASEIEIEWPNGKLSVAIEGSNWIVVAKEAGIVIPTGCLCGSCGACEIEVNGKVLRACISNIEASSNKKLKCELYADPYW